MVVLLVATTPHALASIRPRQGRENQTKANALGKEPIVVKILKDPTLLDPWYLSRKHLTHTSGDLGLPKTLNLCTSFVF